MPNKPTAQVRKWASTLCLGIKPCQRSARPPPTWTPDTGGPDAGLRRPRKGWRAGILLAPDVGIATRSLPRGTPALGRTLGRGAGPQIFSEAGCTHQPSLGTWGPGGRRPAGLWSGLRERTGRDASVGAGRTRVHQPDS